MIGPQFNPGPGGSNLHGSVLGLIIGMVGLIYGAQGVTQTAQQALAQVWNVPRFRLPGFLPRLARSLIGLTIIGGAFLFAAFIGAIAGSNGQNDALRLLLVAGMLLGNIAFYFGAFWVLTPKVGRARQLLPGAVLGAVSFTLLTTVGTALVQHQLRHSTETYGAFAVDHRCGRISPVVGKTEFVRGRTEPRPDSPAVAPGPADRASDIPR